MMLWSLEGSHDVSFMLIVGLGWIRGGWGDWGKICFCLSVCLGHRSSGTASRHLRRHKKSRFPIC